MKKQDEWEKIVRSKLEDYEVQPDPADWDAIVGRLTRRRLWPRRWMYAAAAVALLMLLFEGGRRLWRPDEPSERMADAKPVPTAPIATPSVAMPSASSLHTTVATPPTTAVAQVRTRTKAAPQTVAPAMTRLHAATPQEVLPPPTDQPTDEPSVPDNAWLAETTISTADSLSLYAAEIPTAEEIEEAIEQSSDRMAVAATRPARRWGFGMGGGGYTTGLQGGGGDFNATFIRDDSRADLPPYDYGEGTADDALAYHRNEADRIDVKHARPLSFGLGVSYRLSDRWALQSGLTYTCLTSRWRTASIFDGHIRQRLHFVGIPVGVAYRIADWRRVRFYAAAGGAVEWNVAGSLRTVHSYGTGRRSTEQSQRMKEWQWSTYARTGATYPLLPFLSLYAEVGASYYFDNGSSIETIRSAKPFYLSLQTGLRLGL